MAESGYCSAVALPAVAATVEAGPDERASVRWKAVALDKRAFARDPEFIVRLQTSHELARLPLNADQCEVPLTLSALAHLPPLELAIDGLVRSDTWDSERGQLPVVKHEEISCTVASPPRANEPSPTFENLSRHWISVESLSRDDNHDDGRVHMVWQMPEHLRLITLQIQSASRGVVRWTRDDQSIYQIRMDNRFHEFQEPLLAGSVSSYNCGLEVGESERVTCTYTWRDHQVTTNLTANGSYVMTGTKEVGPVITARVSAVRGPLPTGLAAVPGNRQVTLRWDSLHWNERDWAEGPWFVLLRSDGERAGVDGKQLDLPSPQEILRTNASVTSFIDHGVTNGHLYFYTLRVEGVTRATSWCQEIGEYPCLLPVVASIRTGDNQQRYLSAMPEEVRHVRVAFVTTGTKDPRANSIQAQCFRALRMAPWVQLIERSAGSALFEETEIAKLQSSGLAPAPPADIILQCRLRRSGYHEMLDVWLDDFKNSHRERVLSQSLDDFTLEGVSRQLIDKLAGAFPTQVASFPSSVQQTCAPIHTIAVAAMRPVSTNTLNTAQFESLLTSIITQDGCIKVVEREKLALALKELAAVKLTDQQSAVRLGQLLTADAILSGFYAVDNGQVALSARLIDAGTGEIINVFELTGRWEDPQSLCRELGQQVVAASKVGRTAIDSPLLRWMESQTYLRGSDDKLAAAKIAGYVSPETADYYYQIGQEQRQHGEIEEALASYYNGLNKVGQTEDSWRFYEAIGELLDLLHRPEEAVQLWQRAVSDREGRSLDAFPALLNLAYAELQLGHTQQVAEALSRIEKPTYLAGRMYEKIGRKSDAVPVYAAAAWERMPYFGRSLGGSYPALVRLLDDAGFAERTNVLSRMALVSGSDRPCQANKAAVELVRLGASINPAWLAGVTDSPKLEQHLREFADSRPNTLDCMQAYWRLATLYRERGDMMAERESLRKLEQEHVQGEQADRLRTMAERRVTTPWIRQPTPLAPSTASDQLPSQTEVGASDEQQTYRVDPLGVVYAVERTSDRILWRYDMHPRSVGGTRFRSATGTVEPAFCVVLAIRRHAYSCHGWRDELLASRSAGVGGHDGPWGWGVVRVQHHRRSVARH